MKRKVVEVIYEEMYCPKCGKQHLDEGEWEKKLHKTHLCLHCNHLWKPYKTPSFGVKKEQLK